LLPEGELAVTIVKNLSTVCKRELTRSGVVVSHRLPMAVCRTLWRSFAHGHRFQALAAAFAALAAVCPGLGWAAEKLPVPLNADRAVTSAPAKQVQVWVDLTLPTLAAMHLQSEGSRASQIRAIDSQQDDLALQLRDLGATELGRVRLVRNAIAIEVHAEQLDRIRALPGVRSVTPIRHAELNGVLRPVR
jgi:hypothetical protein